MAKKTRKNSKLGKSRRGKGELSNKDLKKISGGAQPTPVDGQITD